MKIFLKYFRKTHSQAPVFSLLCFFPKTFSTKTFENQDSNTMDFPMNRGHAWNTKAGPGLEVSLGRKTKKRTDLARFVSD